MCFQPGFTIRKLEPHETLLAFPIVQQLRYHLDREEFQRLLDVQTSLHGYCLYGAIAANGSILGVIGLRPVCTLARGDHLHIDDLVVNEADRGRQIGRELLRFAEELACARGMRSIFLDSRQGVEEFYQSLGYLPHSATLMRKSISFVHVNPSGSSQ
jgi:ribosomal protein S18 acetylase RimI-like enzyme